MEHDLLEILKELEACDKGLKGLEGVVERARAWSDAPSFNSAAGDDVVYKVAHVRTILQGAIDALDTVIFDEGIAR